MPEATADLAARVRLEEALLSRRRGAAATIPALPRPAGVGVFRAGPSQEGMWSEIRADPHPAPLIVAGLRLRGPLDLEVLRQAVRQVAARHETLRTVLRPQDGHLMQVVSPSMEVAVRVTPATIEQFGPVTHAEVDQPFDIAREPLYRIRVLRLAERDHIVLLLLHHLIGDARALEVFARDLTAYYLALLAGADPALPALPIQYADFASWYRSRLSGPHGQELIDYWVDRLAGVRPPALPTDRAPGVQGSVRGRTLYFPMPDELIHAVQQLAGQHRATPFMVGVAAFQTLIARYSGQRDVAVRVPISYRDRPEVHNLIADFSNDIVFRMDLGSDPTFHELIDRVRDAALRDFARHDLPPHLLADRLGDPQLLARLFHLQFTMESEVEVDLPAGPLQAEVTAPPWQYAFRPLAVRVRSSRAGHYCIATYRTAQFSEQRISDIVHDFRDLLAQLVARPCSRIFGAPGGPPGPALRVPIAPAAGPAADRADVS